MKRFALALGGAVIGYATGLFGTLIILPLLSSNRHDGPVEASMTGAFLVGPFLAVVLFAGALIFSRRRR